MAWTKISATCLSVYGALDNLHQFDGKVTFEDLGPLTMQDLQFFNPLASDGIHSSSALALAEGLDNKLVNGYGGSYKTGFNNNKAVSCLAAVLKLPTKTVEDLSDCADNMYSFL